MVLLFENAGEQTLSLVTIMLMLRVLWTLTLLWSSLLHISLQPTRKIMKRGKRCYAFVRVTVAFFKQMIIQLSHTHARAHATSTQPCYMDFIQDFTLAFTSIHFAKSSGDTFTNTFNVVTSH